MINNPHAWIPYMLEQTEQLWQTQFCILWRVSPESSYYGVGISWLACMQMQPPLAEMTSCRHMVCPTEKLCLSRLISLNKAAHTSRQALFFSLTSWSSRHESNTPRGVSPVHLRMHTQYLTRPQGVSYSASFERNCNSACAWSVRPATEKRISSFPAFVLFLAILFCSCWCSALQ